MEAVIIFVFHTTVMIMIVPDGTYVTLKRRISLPVQAYTYTLLLVLKIRWLVMMCLLMIGMMLANKDHKIRNFNLVLLLPVLLSRTAYIFQLEEK
jgi:hypothetical protein